VSLFTNFDHTVPPLGSDGTPLEFYEALRDEMLQTGTDIGWSEQHGGFWVATGYDVVRDIFHDTAHFSNKGVTFPAYAVDEDSTLMLAAQDAPEHKKYRRLVQGPFSPQKVQSFNEPLKAMTNKLIDGFIEDGEVDLVPALTDAVPSRMTAVILGIDPEDGDLYRKWCWAITHLFLEDPQTAAQHVAEMDAYFVETLAHRKQHLGDDVLSLVIQSEVDGEKLTDQEIKDFFIVLLLGGIENTSKLLSTMFWRLGWDIEMRRRMRNLRGEQMLLAMDEFLRYYTPAWLGRLITEDVEIGGVQMQKGQHVILHNQIANRDPRQFVHPDALVLDREPNRHFGLGMGVHRCLGAHLVRYEGQIVAEAMLSRIPEFELDRRRTPTWINGQVSGMADVHLVFPRGGGGRAEPRSLAEAA
jgi:cytochrome P450